MTAEVGILNTVGVALAADSAVTIGSDADKIYSSAEKLFHLSESAPVGVMINGNAAFLGVPWETIIKAYRKKNKENKFAMLSEYRDDFIEFLESNRQMFSRETKSHFVSLLINIYLRHIRDKVRITLDRRAEKSDGLGEDEIAPIVHEVIEKNFKFVTNKDKLTDFNRSITSEIRKQYTRRITASKKKIFADLPMQVRTSRLISRLVIEVLTRDHMSPFKSGVVIAGFGEKEFMPRLYSVNVEIMAGNKLRAASDKEVKISHKTTASIVPFAQQEMVHTFLNGIDPGLANRIDDSSEALFHGIFDVLLSEVASEDQRLAHALRERLSSRIDKLVESLHQDWKDQSRNHWMPIIKNVSSLPKDELGSMAEALVNLTKFRRRVSQERETVGGPIDVAVITKGDGFVWVKRKHYFEPRLNPRTMAQFRR